MTRILPAPRILRLPAAMILLTICGGLPFSSTAAALAEVTDFGPNPTNLRMFLYIPDNAPVHPAVLVGIHWCHGTAQAFYGGNRYKVLADQYKYMVIYPNANSDDSCFDVHSQGTLTHDGGGDALGIASMVRYVIKNNNADSTRVYAAGHSSGGMMCNVLAGSYPDLFKAVSASAGVPFGCFGGGTSSWNDSCAKGLIVKTGESWGDMVRAAFPGYAGPRPRMQIWHGEKDDILNFINFGEAIKQWCNVLGIDATPATTEANTPKTNYTRLRYSDDNGTVMIEAVKGADQSHNISIVDADVIKFFGLDNPTALNGIRHRRHSAPGISLRIEPSSPQGIRLSVASRPGRIGVRLFQLDGREIASFAERFRADGRRDIVLPHPGRRTAVALVAVTVDGVPAVRRHLLISTLSPR
ncbi:MAG: PHB depolymerase family esterase [Chitinispirillaceae bacterium]|nr:PHB depolymerase family esterase [Chitinispirillaceae bacterium]